MDTEKIRSIFEQEGVTTGISCGKAFEISEKHGVSKQEIAQYCNVNKIKIRSCQLGCFP
ncbi:MAG: hypothetical protein LUQ50_01165 [Methanospirillum sp.]|uniref:hypothetical protein n=1 Tax=Methanospirillum sp. TaxID=45200 RepID=UPI0023761519|nr:hypothetical protein [Methanospirillum sp.]MDD1727662.1 hypothetical protein [Methanospirillum sp.]